MTHLQDFAINLNKIAHEKDAEHGMLLSQLILECNRETDENSRYK